jgi:HPt (histidine-containing phosphotransfer) domain-containing protein
MNSPDIHSVIEQLRGAYVRSLSQKIEALRGAVARRNFKEVLVYAHQMKGSGRSYGFPEISDIAASIEEAATEHLASVLKSLLVELERTRQRISQDTMPTT